MQKRSIRDRQDRDAAEAAEKEATEKLREKKRKATYFIEKNNPTKL